MNSEFQVLRWGIPGWIFIATFFVFKLAAVNFQIEEITKPFGQNPGAIAGIGALFVALGVPIGYVLYQIYFCLKWTIGGRKAYLAAKNVKGLENVNTGNIRADWRAIERYLDKLMTIDVQQKDVNYKDIVRRYDWYSNRTSRTHGLGATVISMVSGLLLFVLLNHGANVSIFYMGVALVPYIVALVAIIINYNSMNEGTFLQLNSIMIDIQEAPLKNSEEKDDEDD
jgi:hypothetical protein